MDNLTLHTVSSNIIGEFEYFEDIAVLPDGSVALGGYLYSATTSDDPWIVKLNSTLNMVYQRKFVAPGEDWCNSISSLTAPKQYFFLGCVTESFGPVGAGKDMLTIKVVEANPLSVSWRARYATADRDEGLFVLPNADGGALMVGSHSHLDDYASEGALFVKTEYNGLVQVVNRDGSSAGNPYDSTVSMTIQPTYATVTDLTGSVTPVPFEYNQSTASESAEDVWTTPFERMTN